MRQGLFQQQTTKLVMTNELRQAISLLQFSSVELVQFLQEQAIENPLLNVESVHFEQNRINKKSTPRDQHQIADIHDQSTMTIQDHLLSQVGLLNLSLDERNIMNYLILFIDEHGYFVGNLEEISDRFVVPISVVEILLGKIQDCEPIGVGARDLKECLIIQLKNLPSRNLIAELIVENHLQSLADRKWKEISVKIGEPIEAVQVAFDLIQTLEPRPGSHFSIEKPEYIVPDLIVTEGKEGLVINLNEHLIPKIKLEPDYKQYIKLKDHDAYRYVREKLDQVHFIKRAFEQRLITMKKVMTAIVERQSDFFYNEKANLKPLTMKDIANEISVHESTVSRTVNGKYVQTTKGVFELKYFFTSSIQSDDREDTSSKVVKDTIIKVIEEENKKQPLSDQQIADILKEQYSYHLSRRTVAKYRDQLRILPSSKRKRY